jgi:tryptophan 2,3-dioxygenase
MTDPHFGEAGYELWLKQMLHELTAARDRLLVPRAPVRRLDEPSPVGRVPQPARSAWSAGGRRRRAARLVAADRAGPDGVRPLWDLAEGLLEHDSRASQWRSRHVDMVERVIGTRSGTGGSSGAPYLRGRLALRYYPELWELRSSL